MKAAVPRFSVPALGCSFRLLLLLGLALLALGCKPDIGDKCTTSTDCSIAGERLCDLTQPGGYCTIFNCEPNLCPEKSVCVAFGERTCSVQAVTLRFRRTFCMKSCDKDSDCRNGDNYHCVDIANDTSRRVVDTNPESNRVCGIPAAYDVPAVSPNPPVCYPSDASFDVDRPEAGPTIPDANGSETPMSDSAGDRIDAALGDRPIDMTSDGLDSSRSETGADIEPDMTDEETGTSDAPDESTADVETPADADGQADAGQAVDASVDVSAD
jgi:hypothetical protein